MFLKSLKEIGCKMSETKKKKTFRERLLGWGVKILLALLILSFGVWGIGDYVAPQQDNEAIATVGKSKILISEFQNAVQFQVNRLRSVLGENFTVTKAKKMGVTENVLNSLIQQKIFSEGAIAMGLVISDNLVARKIRDDDRFKSQGGTFDRFKFDETIQSAGLSEGNYISLYKRQLLQDQFLSSIYTSQFVPKPLVDSIYKFRNEKRSMNFIEIKHGSIVKVPRGSEQALKKFHKDNSRQFTSPEYRAITIVQIQIKDIIDEIDVSDIEIKEVYDDKINDFKTPETRKIQQILVSDKIKSHQIYDKIKTGVAFEKVAKNLANLGAQSLELGTLNRSQIPIKEIADTAFSIIENTISTPVQSPLGWHILRVKKINPEQQKMLVEVKSELKNLIAAEKAVDTLYNLSNKYEDELASGLTIEQAAKRLNFKIQTIPAVNAEGRDITNKKILNLNSAIVQVAFNTEQDQDSALTDFGDSGYFILHVNGITAPTLKPFETIRSDVESAWLRNQQKTAAKIKIKSFINRLKGPTTLENIAQELNIKIKKSSDFLRTGAGLKIQVPGQLISALFDARKKAFVSVTSDDSSFIGQIRDIKSADLVSDKKSLAVLKQELAESISSDMSTQLASALHKKLGVSINNVAVDSAF